MSIRTSYTAQGASTADLGSTARLWSTTATLSTRAGGTPTTPAAVAAPRPWAACEGDPLRPGGRLCLAKAIAPPIAARIKAAISSATTTGQTPGPCGGE